jgi:hypothetical protein
VAEDPASADKAVAAAVDAVAIWRDVDDEDDEELYEEVELDFVLSRSDVLFAIENDEELLTLFGGAHAVWRCGGAAPVLMGRTAAPADPCEMAILRAYFTSRRAEVNDDAPQPESVAMQLVRLAKASTQRRLTYVADKAGKPPGRYACKSIRYDPKKGSWRIEWGDGWAESALGSDAATPCEVSGWEYDDGHYATWGLSDKIRFVTLASTRWDKVRAAVRVRLWLLAWQEHTAERLCAPGGAGRRADRAAFAAEFVAADAVDA